jgi:arylsulfatase A-like enzyme
MTICTKARTLNSGWFVFALLFLSQIASGQVKTKPSIKPNILWIVANDISNDLACYGNTLVHTPNLDGLAKRGVLYRNHIVVGAVCSPNRSAFITGMHAVSINSHNQFPTVRSPLPAGIKPVTEYLRQDGYYLANTKGPEMEGPYSSGYNFQHDAEKMYDGFSWEGRKPGQPFFAQVHLTNVHRPFFRDPSRPINPDQVVLPPYYPDHKIARQDWVMYLETIQLLDKQIGEILAKLKKDGLEENTVVFFFGDHGRAHIRDKQFLYDGGVNAPLIVSWPGKIRQGVKDDRLISNVDHAATLLQLAGVKQPDHMQGRDYLNAKSKPNSYVFSARDRCDGTLDRIRMVRTKDFKLIRNFYPDRPYTQYSSYKRYSYPMWTLMKVLKEQNKLNAAQSLFLADTRPEYELYDVKNDPHELNNLSGNSANNTKLNELKKVLNDWIAKADKGPHPENSEEIKKGIASMGADISVPEEQFLETWEKRLAQFFN